MSFLVYFLCLIKILTFKLRHKASEANCNINDTFGEGTVSERTTQW